MLGCTSVTGKTCSPCSMSSGAVKPKSPARPLAAKSATSLPSSTAALMYASRSAVLLGCSSANAPCRRLGPTAAALLMKKSLVMKNVTTRRPPLPAALAGKGCSTRVAGVEGGRERRACSKPSRPALAAALGVLANSKRRDMATMGAVMRKEEGVREGEGEGVTPMSTPVVLGVGEGVGESQWEEVSLG